MQEALSKFVENFSAVQDHRNAEVIHDDHLSVSCNVKVEYIFDI